jgi:polar amino acid transport system permease protein
MRDDRAIKIRTDETPEFDRMHSVKHPGRVVASVVVGIVLVLVSISVGTNPNFQWGVVATYMFDPSIIAGLGTTAILTVVAMAMGLVLGMALALMRLSRNPLLLVVSWAYTWFFRSVPQLVQLIFWFNFGALYSHIVLGVPFGPELFSWRTNDIISPWSAAILGLGLSQAAYTGEVIRAGISSVAEGQTRAALALGMPPSLIYRKIILPQTMKLVIPPIANEVISMVKATALVSTIALSDLLYSAQLIYSRTYETIPLLLVASIWYLLVVSLLSVGQHFLEKRYRHG